MNYQELKEQFNTPLYLYDEDKILATMKDYKENFISHKFKTKVLYASKALSIIYIYKLCEQMGLHADVVSEGEIYTALKAKMDPTHLYFHGNNKTKNELSYAIKNGVKHIVIDSLDDAKNILEVAQKENKVINALIRLNVGVEAHTHKFIVTANIDSKFGVLLDSTELKEILDLINNSKFIKLEGFHSHIGSQIMEMEGFYAAIDKLLAYVKTFPHPLALNIGGGFAARYVKEDKPVEVKMVAKNLVRYVENKLDELNLSITELMIEPGRSVVCEAGSTLYTIGNLKQTPHRKYYFIDGGMTDNIRPALYQAKYDAFIVGKEKKAKEELVTIAGKCCESGDIIIEDIMLPEAKAGDLLVVKSTGAYGYSMASNYNKALRPAVVFVKGNEAKLVVKRQTLNDLIGGEIDEI